MFLVEQQPLVSPDGSDLLKQPWTPFVPCLPDARDPESEISLNSRYQVHRRLMANRHGPDLIHLSFKRNDQRILVPYEDKLRIKDELIYPECEGVELLPARSREVDMANQYHCWVISNPGVQFPLPAECPFPPLALPLATQQTASLSQPWTPLSLCEKGVQETYRNSRYQIQVQRWTSQEGGAGLVALLCQRLDGLALFPYRDKMRIKDEIVHAQCEGVELLPARSRVVVPQKGCLLWIIDDPTFRFPFGFPSRFVTDIGVCGAVQEPWPPDERPTDCLSEADLWKLAGEAEGKEEH